MTRTKESEMHQNDHFFTQMHWNEPKYIEIHQNFDKKVAHCHFCSVPKFAAIVEFIRVEVKIIGQVNPKIKDKNLP